MCLVARRPDLTQWFKPDRSILAPKPYQGAHFIAAVTVIILAEMMVPLVCTGEELKAERYVSLYALGALPNLNDDQTVHVSGLSTATDQIGSGIGGGIKVGVFPRLFGNYLGFEGEFFAQNGNRSSAGKLDLFNWMGNMILRYPDPTVQPYVGIGLGFSRSHLSDANIRVSSLLVQGNGTSTGGGVQLIAGMRVNMPKQLFLFAEFKHFESEYEYSGPNKVKLEFQREYLSGGIGFRF